MLNYHTQKVSDNIWKSLKACLDLNISERPESLLSSWLDAMVKVQCVVQL